MKASSPNGLAKYETFDEGNSQKGGFTIEEAIEHIGVGWPQLKIGCMAGFAWVSDGMELMVISILGPILQNAWGTTPVENALISTMVFVGFFIGSPVFGVIADKYGRRTSLIISSTWTLVYAVLGAAAPNYYWMLVLRTLLGIGIAGGMQINPYFSEFLPGKHRAKWTGISLLFWAAGSLLNVVFALLLMRYGWRWWLLASAIPSPIFLLFSFILPESPRYELSCGREQKARQILENLAAANGRSLPPGELRKVKQVPRGSMLDLFSPGLKRTSIILVGLWFSAGLLYYGIILCTTHFIRLGKTCIPDGEITLRNDYECHLNTSPLTMNDYLQMMWTSSADLPGVALTIIFTSIVGRKLAMVYQLMLSGICCLLLNICMSSVPMTIILVIARAFAVAVFQVVIVYTSEIYPTEIRSLGSGCGNAMARLGGMITPYIAQVLLNYSSTLTLGIYVIVALLSAVGALLLPIETKGKRMAESHDE